MEPLEQSTGRSVRLALVAVGLLALLAVVAFASRSGLGHQSQATPTPGYVSYAFSAFLIVFVLAIPVAAYAFLLQAREGAVDRKPFRTRVISNLLTVLFFLCLAIVVVYIKRHHGSLFQHLDTSGVNKANEALKHHKSTPTKYAPQFEWLVLWIALAFLAAGTVALVISRRRRKRRVVVPLDRNSTVAADLASSMSDAIEDLEAEPDARRAVIAAYARMEGVLARHGLRRRPSETPLEYLRRTLLAVTTRSDAVRRLTSLFEQAKFSHHEINASMKQDAIDSLRLIRDDLTGAAV